MSFSLPRGMRDLDPDTYEILEKIRFEFMYLSKLFGFKIMEPSPIETLGTLEAKSGQSIKDEIYYFKDKGNRDIGLRFDLTVGLTRYVSSQRGLPMPFRLGSFSGMWRYDEPQLGRYRWFYQWDVEIYGPKSSLADAEVIDFTWNLFKRLDLNHVKIHIGDRNLVEEYISNILEHSSNELIMDSFRALDKVSKKGRDSVVDEYVKKGFSKDTISKILDILNVTGSPDTILNNFESMGVTHITDLRNLLDSLDDRGLNNIVLDVGVVRGLDYYNGIVFEVVDPTQPNLGSLAGGGRYDSLPEIFGRNDIGATGAAGGIDRIIVSIKNKSEKNFRQSTDHVYVIPATSEFLKDASSISSSLRQNDISSISDTSYRGLGKQLKLASSSNSKLAIIIGSKEYSKGNVLVKDLLSGQETVVTLKNLINEIKSRLG
jgi:histidyl-tRNA synthetase|tara:strand:+ start:3156 stop:4445 length:1290 start_codon:yes stop_codon:yes gene_type:complete